MAEIVGRMTCPVCGESMQDVKINKNNKLYLYCDNGCSVRFNSKISRQSLPLLRSKKTAVFGNIRILPVQDCGNFAVDDEDDF